MTRHEYLEEDDFGQFARYHADEIDKLYALARDQARALAETVGRLGEYEAEEPTIEDSPTIAGVIFNSPRRVYLDEIAPLLSDLATADYSKCRWANLCKQEGVPNGDE